MAKGKVKSLLNFTGERTLTRNGVELTFQAVELDRGTDKVPAVNIEWNPATLFQFVAKDEKPTDEKALPGWQSRAGLAFNTFINDSLNAYAKLAWRQLVDGKPVVNPPVLPKNASPEQGAKHQVELAAYDKMMDSLWQEFGVAFNALVNGERKEREKDASYYRRLCVKLMTEAKAEKDVTRRGQLVIEAKQAKATAEEKEAMELEAMLSLADELEINGGDAQAEEVEASDEDEA